MIDDLDDALRDLLIREMPIKNNEIDISFGQPNKEWSSRLSRPTLNLYLHDIRENPTLRRDQNFAELERRPDSVVHRRPPLMADGEVGEAKLRGDGHARGVTACAWRAPAGRAEGTGRQRSMML